MNQTPVTNCDAVIQPDPGSYLGGITNFYVRAHPDIGSNPGVITEDYPNLKHGTRINGDICAQSHRRRDNGCLMHTPRWLRSVIE